MTAFNSRFARLLIAALLLSASFCLVACGGLKISALTPSAGGSKAEASLPAAAVAAKTNRPGEYQPRQLRFEQISLSQGLSESVVRGVLQDRLGFIWFATDDGLNRFDGYNFIVYKNDSEDPNSLSHSQTSKVIEDKQGRLWVATWNAGLNRFDRDTGHFTRYRSDETRPDTLTSNRVNAVLEARDGTIWVGTAGGLNRYDPKIDGFWHYQNQTDKPNSLLYNNVLALADAPDGTLWIGTGKGLDRFDPDTGQFTHYTYNAGESNSLRGKAVASLAFGRTGELWIGLVGDGVDRLDPQTGQFTHYPLNGAQLGSSGSYEVGSILEDSDGVVWAGPTASGLCRLQPGETAFTCFRRDPSDPNSLSANDVLSLYEDRAGILWVGTYGGGVNRLDPAYKPFEHIRNVPNNPNSLAGSLVFAVLRDQAGLVWVGTEGDGLDRIDRKTGQIIHFRSNKDNPNTLSDDRVHALLQDQQGVLWVGTLSGLNRLDPGADHFVRYMADPSSGEALRDDVVVSLAEDPQGRLWVATRDGLHWLDRQTGKFTNYYNKKGDPNSLTDSPLSSIFIDSRGWVWAGTMSRGLEQLDPRTGKVTHYVNNSDNPKSLSDPYVLSITEDHAGTIWVGTTSGLNRLDRESGTFRHYRTEQGLPNDFIYTVVEDQQGSIWTSTNKGLSRFDPKTGLFKNFDAPDGLQSNEFNAGAVYQAADGELFFGGINGVTSFYPQNIRENPYIPPVVLTSLTQHGEKVGVDLSRMQKITVRWPDNYFDFEFAALNYVRPENNEYAYILEGFDHEWNAIGAKRSGRYTNLPGGNYTLRLKGSNNDGLWNEAGAAIRVEVIPPVWATWWFRSATVLLMVGAVAGGVRMRVREMESRNRNLERLVRARTAEIERLYEQTKELAVVEERNRLARDLHDSAKQKAFAALAQLGAANGLVLGNPPKASQALREAETLVYEVIEELTFLIQEMYPAALKEKGLPTVLREYMFEWESRSEIRVDFIMLNERPLALQTEQALYRTTQEALANVARHSRANKVEVTVEYDPDEVKITIADDGQGFDLARRALGVGLRSMQERIAMIGGVLSIESAPGKGTRVLICAPAQASEAAAQSLAVAGRSDDAGGQIGGQDEPTANQTE